LRSYITARLGTHFLGAVDNYLTMAAETGTQPGYSNLELSSIDTRRSRRSYSRPVLVLVGLVLFSFATLFRNNTHYDHSIGGEERKEAHLQEGASTRESRVQLVELTNREEQWGSWTGDTWIPPREWRYYSALELKEFYQGKSVMWVGDSLARRTYGTMYGILNATDSSSLNTTSPSSMHVSVEEIDSTRILDASKENTDAEVCKMFTSLEQGLRPRLCRFTPGAGGGLFLQKHAPCLKTLETFVKDELSGKSNTTADIDVIIISLGIWDLIRPDDCREEKGSPRRSILQRQDDVMDLLGKLQSPQRTIVWRTCGTHAEQHKEGYIAKMNRRAMDKIDEITLELRRNESITSNLTYVDWGGAIFPRSIGKERIIGNMAAHYGLVPRHVLIQMITNHLASRGFGAYR
jgi:hypothetical protein